MRQPTTGREYCHNGDPNCIRAWLHTDDCKPGCRICHTADHLTPKCPSWSNYVLGTDDQDQDDMDQLPAPHPIPWDVEIKGLITGKPYHYVIKAAPDAYAGDVRELAVKRHHTALSEGRVGEPAGPGGSTAPRMQA